MVAAWVLPGVDIDELLGRAARRRDRRGAERGHPAGARCAAAAADARARLPARADRGRRDPPGPDALTDGVLTVDNFGWALLAALVVAAVSVVLAVLLGSDDMSSIRIAHRIARRQGIIASTDVPGIIYLEIDGLALPVLRRAMRDGNAPNMARWARATRTVSRSGRPISPRRRARARRGSCWGRTRTSRRSAGSRRRRRR